MRSADSGRFPAARLYNLGLKGLANSEFGPRSGVDQSRGALALSALSQANDHRLKANQLATNTATSTGLILRQHLVRGRR